MSSLHSAVKNNDIALIHELLKKGEDCDSFDDERNTPLMKSKSREATEVWGAVAIRIGTQLA